MGTGGGDTPGCLDDSPTTTTSHSISSRTVSLRDAVRRNTVTQMACDSSTRILEHQKNAARCLLLRQERMLRSQLMTRMAEAERTKVAASKEGDAAGGKDEAFDKSLDSTADLYNRVKVVTNPYPITPKPKHNVSNVSSKSNQGKKMRRRLKVQHISLDLDELPVEHTRPRPSGSEGHSPRASLSRLPSLSSPWVSAQGDYADAGGDGVWLGQPEAINSIRRTLRPARMAEVRLLRRTQSLREPSVFGTSRCGSDEQEEGLKGKCPPLRSFSMGDYQKTGLERGVVNLALGKKRSSSLRMSRDEGQGRESLFQRNSSWKKGGKGDGDCCDRVERGQEGSGEMGGGRLPPILSAAMEIRELDEEVEEEEPEKEEKKEEVKQEEENEGEENQS